MSSFLTRGFFAVGLGILSVHATPASAQNGLVQGETSTRWTGEAKATRILYPAAGGKYAEAPIGWSVAPVGAFIQDGLNAKVEDVPAGKNVYHMPLPTSKAPTVIKNGWQANGAGAYAVGALNIGYPNVIAPAIYAQKQALEKVPGGFFYQLNPTYENAVRATVPGSNPAPSVPKPRKDASLEAPTRYSRAGIKPAFTFTGKHFG